MRHSKKEWELCEIQVSYTPPKKTVQINSDKAAYQFFKQIWDPGLINIQEQFYILFLNHANQLQCWRQLHTGTVKNIHIDMRMIATLAAKTPSTKAIIAHNHPSGNLIPSKEDIKVTDKISQVLDMFDVHLEDHLIISNAGYYSLMNFKTPGSCLQKQRPGIVQALAMRS